MVQLKDAPEARVAFIAHVREVDQKVADLWSAYWEAMKPGDDAMKSAKEYRSKFERIAKNDRVNFPAEFAAWEADPKRGGFYIAKAAEFEAKAKSIYETARPLADAADKFDRENYEGWQRFFLVQHIHSNKHCSSFRDGTRIGWLPAVSGLTEAEAVAEYGAVMCTICFPSAPIEWTGGQLKEAGICEGSGKSVGELNDRRTGYYSGNGGRCPDCGKWVGTGANAWKIPKHKPQEAAA